MHHPNGSRLPALERNILKFRAFEMVLILFYSETLKSFFISTIEASDRFGGQKPPRILPQTKKKFQVALKAFLDDGVITRKEFDEIPHLVDYRNLVAHDIQKLTGDIVRHKITSDFHEFMGVKYDYKARKRLKWYNEDVPNRANSKYVMEVGMDWLLFEAAEKTYEDELKCLHDKICKQLKLREQQKHRLKNELSLEASGLTEENHPYHPANKSSSGRFTRRGCEICYRLFDLGKRPLAVAYLMRVSYGAALQRLKAWKLAGGQNRDKATL